MLKLRMMAIAMVIACGSGCGPGVDSGVVRAYCEKLDRCDLVVESEDGIRVCTADLTAMLEQTMAHHGPECTTLAQAQQAHWACQVDTGCDDPEPCREAFDTLKKARDAASGVCDA